MAEFDPTSLLPPGPEATRTSAGQNTLQQQEQEQELARKAAATNRARTGTPAAHTKKIIRKDLLDLVERITPITKDASSDIWEQTIREAARNEQSKLQRELLTDEISVWQSTGHLSRIPDFAAKNKSFQKIRAMLGHTVQSMVQPRNLGIDPNDSAVIELLNKLRNEESQMIRNSCSNLLQRKCMRWIELANRSSSVPVPGESRLALAALQTGIMAGLLAPLAPIVGGFLFQALARKTTIVMIPYGKENMRIAASFRDAEGKTFIFESTYSQLELLLNAYNNKQPGGKDAAKRKMNLYKGRVFGERQALQGFVNFLKEHQSKVEQEATRLTESRAESRRLMSNGLSAAQADTEAKTLEVEDEPLEIVGEETPPCEPSARRDSLHPEQQNLFDILLDPNWRRILKDTLPGLLLSPEQVGTRREVLDELLDLAKAHDKMSPNDYNDYQEAVFTFVEKIEHQKFISSNFKSDEGEDDYENDDYEEEEQAEAVRNLISWGKESAPHGQKARQLVKDFRRDDKQANPAADTETLTIFCQKIVDDSSDLFTREYKPFISRLANYMRTYNSVARPVITHAPADDQPYILSRQ